MSAAGNRDAYAVLSSAMDRSFAGRGEVVLVSGAVGIGKTELVFSTARQARERGARSLVAVASHASRQDPLDLLRRPLASADLSPEQARTVDQLLNRHDGSTVTVGGRAGTTREPTPKVRKDLADFLLRLADTAPLMIGVDDVDFAHETSLQFLLYLSRRVNRAPILIVLTESAGRRTLDPRFRAEVRTLPHGQMLRLRPMDTDTVKRLLNQQLGGSVTDELVTAYQNASGGNPLLLNALIDDHRQTGPRTAELTVGDAFVRATLTCLHRSGPLLIKLIRALAVLDAPLPLPVLAEIIDTDLFTATRTMQQAEETGLVAESALRHPRTRTAVLDAMLPEERAALHERVAGILHHNGAPSTDVARQLVAARRLVQIRPTGEQWRVPLLIAAARQAGDHDSDFVLDCLRLAGEWCTADADRIAILQQKVRAQWRLDPASARGDVADLLEAARAGRMSPRAALDLTLNLIWFGQVDEAMHLLDRMVEAGTADEPPDTVMALFSSVAQLHYLYPAACKPIRVGTASPLPPTAGTTLRLAHGQALGVVDTLLRGAPDQMVEDAERVLRMSPLDDATFGPVWVSLETLLLAERLDRAAYWCDALLRTARSRHNRTWAALFASTRSTIRLRLGDLAGSERSGKQALDLLPPAGWGVLLGLPVATLTTVYDHHGAHAEAEALLQLPVLDAMFQTPAGLQYLRARGHHRLATGEAHAAIQDFERCRDLSLEWGRDLPAALPWRGDLAEAHLALGNRERARELARDQLARLGSGWTRSQGVTTRILAAACDLTDRPALLRDAVELLQSSGDRLELARACTELSEALDALGDEAGARQARRMLERFLAEPAPVDGRLPGDLSEAESRVATLAIQGRTNRQIAEQLNVTVSTVEQHLTRVYRKLNLRGRSELLELPLDQSGE